MRLGWHWYPTSWLRASLLKRKHISKNDFCIIAIFQRAHSSSRSSALCTKRRLSHGLSSFFIDSFVVTEMAIDYQGQGKVAGLTGPHCSDENKSLGRGTPLLDKLH